MRTKEWITVLVLVLVDKDSSKSYVDGGGALATMVLAS